LGESDRLGQSGGGRLNQTSVGADGLVQELTAHKRPAHRSTTYGATAVCGSRACRACSSARLPSASNSVRIRSLFRQQCWSASSASHTWMHRFNSADHLPRTATSLALAQPIDLLRYLEYCSLVPTRGERHRLAAYGRRPPEPRRCRMNQRCQSMGNG